MNRRTSSMRTTRPALPRGAPPAQLHLPASDSPLESMRESAQERAYTPVVLPWHVNSRREHDVSSSAPSSARVATRGALALLDEPLATRVEPPSPQSDVSGDYVLLALDDALLADTMRDALATRGNPAWVVQVASDVAQALELALTHPPRLVLLDIAMTEAGSNELDSAAFYHQMRANPASAQVPVIFATTATSLDLYERGMQEGLLLRKPFDLGDLVQLVREVLAR